MLQRVVRSAVIDAPVERVWAVLRDFNSHDRWHDAVEARVPPQSDHDEHRSDVPRFLEDRRRRSTEHDAHRPCDRLAERA